MVLFKKRLLQSVGWLVYICSALALFIGACLLPVFLPSVAKTITWVFLIAIFIAIGVLIINFINWQFIEPFKKDNLNE